MTSYVRHGAKKVVASFTLISVEVIVLLGTFSAALVTFIGIATMVFKEKKDTFDQEGFQFLSRLVSPVHTDIMRFFTFLGTHTFLIPANLALIFFFLVVKNHRWYSIQVPVVALSSLLLMFLLKFIFQRQRPLTPLLDAAKGFSFPSGHALMSVTFYGLIIFIIWHTDLNEFFKWLLSALLVLLIITIGISRVYLRVHYASDVIAGFCVGLMWLLFSLWVLNKIENYSSKKVDPVVQKPG